MSFRVPTSLTPKQIEEYQRPAEKHFGVQLSTKEAEQEGLELIDLFATVIKAEINSIHIDPG